MSSDGQQNSYDRYYAKPYLDWSFNIRGKARSFSRLAASTALQMRNVDVLDVGFGAGAMLLRFDHSCRIAGLDYSSTAVDRVRRLAKRRGFRAADFRTWDGSHDTLPYDNGSFDVVIASHILEHLPDDNVLVVEAHRLLRVGGHLIVMVPLDDSTSLARNPDHVRLYNTNGVRTLLERVGFNVIAFHQDHRVENLLQMIAALPILERMPRLRSRVIGSVSLLLSVIPGSERLPFPGPCRNLAIISEKS